MNYAEINKIAWSNRLVRSNDFASAIYTLPPDAHRILSVAISMIRQKDECFHTFRIYTKQLIEFFPALKSDKNAITRLDKATDALMGSYIKRDGPQKLDKALRWDSRIWKGLSHGKTP